MSHWFNSTYLLPHMAKKKKINKPNQKRSKPTDRKHLITGIMAMFRENPSSQLNYKQVASRLEIGDPAGRQQIMETLRQLVEMELLLQPSMGKFAVHPSQLAVLEGTIDFTKSGGAYVTTDGPGGDIFIPEKYTANALHGDRVQINILRKGRSQMEGKVERVVSRGSEQYVGIIEISETHAFFVPTSQRIHVDFFIDKSKLKGAKNGQKVIAKLLDWPDTTKSPFAEVIDVLGEPGEHNVEMHAILVEFGLPYEFPQFVLDAAQKINVNISAEEIAKRRDMRNVTTFTIDPDDAKDFDDALSIRPLDNGNHEVGVHIADVSHYVKPGDIIDAEAVKRATSVYLVDRVVPMLPEVLSNYVCSLRPNEDKLCMSAIFEINASGKVLNSWFGRTVINSNKRYAYEDAQKVIESGDDPYKNEINQLQAWAKLMRAERLRKGALEFSGSEVKFRLDEKGKPIGVYEKVMKEANWLIEEFMLLANRRVAEHIGMVKKGEQAKTYVYRIHDLPDPEKLSVLRDFVSGLGYKLSSVDPEQASRALNQLMAQVKDKPEEDIVKQMAIRSMAKAVYSTDNIGHYGLAFSHYTHFTSPIRRYPDVIAHRLLMEYMAGGKSASANEVELTCKHASNMEKKAADAERASVKYKQVEFMLDKIGEVFQGTVSGLTRWGMYVELEGNKCEGMIPLNSMDNDVYRYDERKNRIVGLRYKEAYEFGDSIKVRVHGADLLQKQLEFRLA